MQPLRGFIPPRVIGRSHLISYGRDGLRAKTSGAMFSIGDSMQGKDRTRATVGTRARSLGNEDLRMCL